MVNPNRTHIELFFNSFVIGLDLSRDLKPENIVLTARKGFPVGRYLFKVTDLGYAKELDHLQSFANSFVGTFAYLVRFVIEGNRSIVSHY